MSGRNPKALGIWGKDGMRAIAAESYWRGAIKWNEDAKQAGERRRVFCASLADVFESPDTMPTESVKPVRAARLRLFGLIQATPYLDWLLLTKRPELIMPLIEQAALDDRPGDTCEMLNGWLQGGAPENVWLGTSVEDQRAADERIWRLIQCPAAIRFLSIEPMLGPVKIRLSDFGYWRCPECRVARDFDNASPYTFRKRYDVDDEVICHGQLKDGAPCDYIGRMDFHRHLHWVIVIVGGESGPGARPMHPDWARSIRDQCTTAAVSFFFKQWGEWEPCRMARIEDNDHYRELDHMTAVHRVGKKVAGRLLDDRTWDEVPRKDDQ
jgi:protein gp37